MIMDIQLDRKRILDGLEKIWTEWVDWAVLLSSVDWNVLSRCPGWTVQDNMAHIVGTEYMLQGHPIPDIEFSKDHLKNPIAEGNERWVQSMRSMSGSEVLEAFRKVVTERLEQLHLMSDEEITKVGWSPVGEVPYLRFMHVRIYDSWLHLEDCREPLGHELSLGGLSAEIAVDEVTTAAGYIIGKKGRAPNGSRVEIVLTGPVERIIRVTVDDRASVVQTFDSEPTVTLTMSAHDWLALTGGRKDPVPIIEDGQVVLGGDEVLARQLVENLAFTI